MPNKVSLEETWDQSYPASTSERLWPEAPVPMLQLARTHFTPGMLIVDAPCGDGKNIFELSEIGPVIGCDTSERALQICEERRQDSGSKNVSVMSGDIFQLPFVSGGISSFFCCDLLGHLPNPEVALAEMKRVCADDGVVIATTFSWNDSVLQDQRMRAIDECSYWFQDQWFFRFYDKSAATKLAEGCGFEVHHIEEFSWIESPHPGYREYEHEHVSWAMVLGIRS